MSHRYYAILGISATGKSTRVYQFLKFAQQFLSVEPIYDKGKEVAKFIPELNLVILGKEVWSQNQTRWQGLDSFTGHFKSTENLCQWVKATLVNHNCLLEGASFTDSHRFRPVYMITELGASHATVMLYLFEEDEKEAYRERVKYRKGTLVSLKDSMWNKNKNFRRTRLKHSRDNEKLDSPLSPELYNIVELRYNEPVTDLGIKLLEELWPDSTSTEVMKEKFLNWSQENDYTKIIRYVNPDEDGIF